jgi:chaperonin GroES
MATSNIDKALYPADGGLPDLMDMGEPALEIEIENPDSVTLADGSMEITIEPGKEVSDDFSKNLAEEMDDSELGALASELMEYVDADINSRKDWTETYVKGLEVLGMKYEERTEPWNGACGVFSTVLTEAAIRFQSETITETFPAQGPVKTEIIGAIDRLKEEAANRVREDMNYRLTEEMPEYRPEHERMLFNLGLAGSAFKKVYYDPGLRRQVSLFVPAEDVIIPYGSSGARTAERVTHLMRKTKNDVKKLQVNGFYRDVDLGEPVQIHTDVEKKKAEEQGYSVNEDDRYQIAEIQVDWNLKGYEQEDDIALPYIIAIDRGTNKVLAIYRNWEEEDETYAKRQHLVQYDYVPGFGAYGMGLIHIIGGYARAGTSLIRQLIDAGTLSNLPGGMKSRGLRVKGDDTPIAPGEFRDVDVPSGSIKDNIMMLPYKEPSQVLAALLNQITEEGRRLGSIADMKVSDMSAQAPVGTTLALLERQLKIMGAVQARVHNSMKEEFKLLKNIIRDHAPASYDYDPVAGNPEAMQADYDMVEVIPVSDPNSSTMAQRIMQYQAVMQLAQQAPQIYDLPILHRQMIEVLGVKNAEKLVPIDDDMTPRDPISENMAFLRGEPTKAFIYQDHDAHIAAHTTFMQDPMIMQTMGQNPAAQQMMGAIMAHIAEHLAFAYRRKIEEQLGVPLPPPNEKLPEEVEVQLSQLVAQASVQLLQQNMAQMQDKKNQQMQQDPLIQMQQAELQIKAQEAQTRAQKTQADIQLAQEKLKLEAQRIMMDMQKEQQRVTSQERQTTQKLKADMVKNIVKPQPKPGGVK